MKTLNLEEAAKFLHVHHITLQQKAKAGIIPGTKIGRRWVFIDVDLFDYIRAQYESRALQGEQEESECHFINAKTVPTGGSKVSVNGERIQRSTGTTDKLKAQEYHDKLKAQLWDETRLGIKPTYTCGMKQLFDG